VTLRPGINLVRAVAGLAAISITAFFWPPVVFPLLLALLVLAGAVEFDRRQLKRAFAKLQVNRSLPAIIGRGVAFDSALYVTNASDRLLAGQLRDELPAAAVPRLQIHSLQIQGGQSTTFGTRIQIPSRGRHAFGPVWLRAAGPWRLIEGQQPFDCRGSVDVLPETFASRERLQKDLRAELKLLDQMQRSRQHGTGTEFESIHPFRLGDDPRRIDWRATARQRSLLVRRFQVERHRDVMIIIDSGRLMGADVGRGSKLDCAVDAALNLAQVVLHSGDRCGVAAYDREVRGFLPPIAGRSALRSLVGCVYDLQTEWHESDFTPMLAALRSRQAKRTFLIVISDLADAETSQRLCTALGQLQRQHLVLFAALKTPLLDRVVDQPIVEPRDAARKAVAFRLLRDRRRALHSLTRHGVHVLDVEPRQLTTPLINQFIGMRQQNLL
jgi:uncharacterized protein (DUF58 family)